MGEEGKIRVVAKGYGDAYLRARIENGEETELIERNVTLNGVSNVTLSFTPSSKGLHRISVVLIKGNLTAGPLEKTFDVRERIRVPQRVYETRGAEGYRKIITTPYEKIECANLTTAIEILYITPKHYLKMEQSGRNENITFIKSAFMLKVIRSSEELIHEFATPYGTLRKAVKNGTVTERVEGNVQRVYSEYNRSLTLFETILGEVGEKIEEQCSLKIY